MAEVSFCVVNTNQRALLLRGLDAIARERAALPFATEVLVLDNASPDGSAQAAREHPAVDRVIAQPRRAGAAANVNTVTRAAQGRFLLLLNEDAELRPGATQALHAALQDHPKAAVAAARIFDPQGVQQPSAWRFPTPWTAALGPTGRTVQSTGEAIKPVDWAQSCTMLVRREALEEVGGLDEAFFIYSDEVDLQKRLADAGWTVLYVPEAEAVHHEQLSTGAGAERRIVEFSRNRDRYMRKHHGAGAALAVRLITAAVYTLRALAAFVLPGHHPRRYLTHVKTTLLPGKGEGIREAAEAFNAQAARRDASDGAAQPSAAPDRAGA